MLIAIQTGTSTICLFNSWLEGNLQILLTVQAEELTQVLPCSLLGLLCASVMILDIKSLLMKIWTTLIKLFYIQSETLIGAKVMLNFPSTFEVELKSSLACLF